jgi:2-polyprenyl-3-methyl-5-hydroxy-6-metoxy-1,4-benzoquinol methylase
MPTSSSRDASHWNDRFAGEDFIFGTEPNRWLREHAAAFKPRGRILSVADGEGRNSVWLAKQGFQVEAFDFSAVGIAKARKLATQAGVTVDYQLTDCDGFAWPKAAYDGIAAIFVQFADPELRARLFANMIASLAPGGILILQGYTPKQLEYKTGGPSNVSHLYTEAMLRDAFRDTDILELREYEAELGEGAGHHGRSALVGMIARHRQ